MAGNQLYAGNFKTLREDGIMKKNIGSWERTVRVVVGLFITYLRRCGAEAPLGLSRDHSACYGDRRMVLSYALLGIKTCRKC